MIFLLESGNSDLKIESFLWQDLLNASGYNYNVLTSIDDISKFLSDDKIIPLGTIPFTNAVLSAKYNIPSMHPVEIPPSLRIPQLLGRQYNIVTFQDIPHNGEYFIKDASELKQFSCFGNYYDVADKCNPNHLFVVSEVLDIITEYRAYIINGEVYAVEYYNGDPCVLPDMNKITTANMLYGMAPDYPRSYTIDVAVTKNGTFVIEVHPVLFSVGIYTTVLSRSFLQGYVDSLDYILKHNTPVQIS